MSKFDTETVLHKKHVVDIGQLLVKELQHRLEHHDDSKFSQDENKLFREAFDNDNKASLRPACMLHYGANRHHPEHFIDGIVGMNLVDLTEMFIDWCAASERDNAGDAHKSIEEGAKHYDLPDALTQIFHNTAKDFFIGKED